VTLTIPNAKGMSSLQNIIVRINDNNNTFPNQEECVLSNNDMTFINPFLMKKESRVLPNTTDNGTYPNPVSVLGNEIIEYKITAINPTSAAASITIIDTLPAYLVLTGTATPAAASSTTITPPFPARQVLTWTFPSVASMGSAIATFNVEAQSE